MLKLEQTSKSSEISQISMRFVTVTVNTLARIQYFFKKIWHSYVSDRQKGMAYRKRYAGWAFCLLMFYIPTALAINVYSGYNKLGTWKPSISGGSGRVASNGQDMNKPFFWGVTTTDSTAWEVAYCSLLTDITTLDGYSGFVLAPGVLLILSGTITGTTITTSGSRTTNNGKWSANGSFSADWVDYGNKVCAGNKSTMQNTIYQDGPASMNVTYGVYVSPTAKSGKVSTYLRLLKGFGLNEVVTAWVNLPLDLDVNPVQCSVSLDPSVNFGTVEASFTGEGVKVQDDLKLSCDNPGKLALKPFLTVSPISAAGDAYTLPMRSTSGAISGDIRGFIGDSAVEEGKCATTKSSMRVDGASIPLKTLNSSDTWSEKLVWVLCARTNAQPGPATAKAALEVNW